eukprot:TRINITY_DN72289_c0_g1_i1.p1 TRINITY_DN72289_c0_g1~~TRINITY_DN72289_c0_g1_i1.p1  ORF type:complete len:354 (-),score=73.25 TRINITY_DN72289_c0_g1_i1:239-1234(-)
METNLAEWLLFAIVMICFSVDLFLAVRSLRILLPRKESMQYSFNLFASFGIVFEMVRVTLTLFVRRFDGLLLVLLASFDSFLFAVHAAALISAGLFWLELYNSLSDAKNVSSVLKNIFEKRRGILKIVLLVNSLFCLAILWVFYAMDRVTVGALLVFGFFAPLASIITGIVMLERSRKYIAILKSTTPETILTKTKRVYLVNVAGATILGLFAMACTLFLLYGWYYFVAEGIINGSMTILVECIIFLVCEAIPMMIVLFLLRGRRLRRRKSFEEWQFTSLLSVPGGGDRSSYGFYLEGDGDGENFRDYELEEMKGEQEVPSLDAKSENGEL